MVDLIFETKDGESKFTLPKQYLVAVSPYFGKALSGDWVESREQSIRLGPVPMVVMQNFVEWLFTRKVLSSGGLTPTERTQKAIEFDEEPFDWFKVAFMLCDWLLLLYAFGEKFDIPQLRRDTIDETSEIIFSKRIVPSAMAVQAAYNVLPESSPMIKLFIDAYARIGNDLHLKNARNRDIPKEFFADVAIQIKSPKTTQCSPCDYHEHA
jgi:hypothetical protein